MNNYLDHIPTLNMFSQFGIEDNLQNSIFRPIEGELRRDKENDVREISKE